MILTVIQIIVAALLVGAILLQMQGTGLTASFGGGGDFYRSKRSIEKVLFNATIALAVIFALISLILLFPHK